jgi:competence protein ComEC
VLGDGSSMSDRSRQGLRRAGLGHLLALSGLHVGLMAAAGIVVGRLVGGALAGIVGVAAARRLAWLPPMLASMLYLLVVGPRPAIVRASVMALVTWLALARGGPEVRWNTLALVLGAMVLCSPELLRDVGFQLTASATAGILFAVDRTAGGRAAGGRLTRAVRVSVAAQASTLPWALPLFHLATPAAVIHNLWAVPWTAIALFVALSWTLLALAHTGLASESAPVLDLGALPFSLVSRLPGGPWWSTPASVSRARATAVAGAAVAALRRPWLAAALLAAGVRLVDSGSWSRPGVEIAMLDVGQGEALMLRDGGEVVLIDGGGWRAGDVGARVLVPTLARLGVRRVSALALTHPDSDHCRGLVDLAAYLPVAEVWASPGWAPRPCLIDLLTLPGVRWRPLWEGAAPRVGRWRLAVLHPEAGARHQGNDRSLVLAAAAYGFRVLLTGDIELPGERALLSRYPARSLSADLLKVAHHGSRSSSGEEFLDVVSPRMAWISAGTTNRYGHPAAEVLQRLGRRGVRVMRTDREGLVLLQIAPTGRIRIERPGSPKRRPGVIRGAPGGPG